MSCATGTVYGPSRDYPGATVYLRADCRKLSCDHCGPKKAARYRHAIADRAGEHKLQRFMTLTLDPKKIDQDQDSVTYLRKCFAKFRVYLGREFEKVSYIAIVELHKSGLAHLHVLVGVFIPQAWISENWQRVGGGRIVDIRLVDIHNVSAYLSKYVTKDLLLMVPARKKRISTSRNIRLFDPKEKSGFIISTSGIRYFLEFQEGELSDFKFDSIGLVSFVLNRGGEHCLY
jgi:hypothetical protein